MPELPDVEVFRRYLDATSLHQEVLSVKVNSRRILEQTSGDELMRTLPGLELTGTIRHGKYLFVRTSGTRVGGGSPHLLIHFGMTGFLQYFKNPPDDRRHHRAVIDFRNGYHLAYVNQRLLGKFGLVRSPDRYCVDNGIGPDAGELSFDEFRERVRRGRGSVKTTLMNQSIMSGLGNVYADEVLFHARIHPRASIGELDDAAVRRIFDEMHRVLETVIDCKAQVDRMPGSFLVPRRREGAECPGCSGRVASEKLAGRTTYLCPECQTLV
ncbi:Fpg/Nei family DNA glycosylase [Salinispira pacifica]